jgi:ribulose-5-phosphate 4-epimerase/fuculose-1-phosphate aldolase
LPLAQAVRAATERYVDDLAAFPKTIWLQNHGLICPGRTCAEAIAATRMSVKAARVWLQALQTDQKVHELTQEQIARIDKRPDEHYRQRMLWQKI